MSRSERKNPIRGITSAESEKADKTASHRRIRRVVREIGMGGFEASLPLEKELTSGYMMAKDGKARFDPKLLLRLMRK